MNIGLSFLESGGEAGRRLRALDWVASPLGPPAAWPTALQTLVEIMLGSDQAMLIAWGEDLVGLYNDAMAALMGDRHPATLGQPIFDVWPEAAAVVQPLFARAGAGRGAQVNDLVLPIDRDGITVAAHFRSSYSPIRVGANVAGVLCLTTETTEAALSEQRSAALIEVSRVLKDLSDPRAIVAAAVGVLGRRLGALRVGYGEVQADQATIRLTAGYIAGGEAPQGLFPLDSFGAANIAAQRAGRTMAHDDLERAPGEDVARWRAIGIRAVASVPLLREGRLRATLYVSFRDPHAWSPIELSLIEDVAAQIWESLERARAEGELRESEARLAVSEDSLRLATEAAEVGIWDLDLATETLTWSARTKAMFGISPDLPCSMADFYEGLHPEDRAATVAAFEGAIDPERRLKYDVDYRTVGKEDGLVRWVAAKGLGLFDAAGTCTRALGTAIDVTARKQADEQARLQAAQLRQALDSLATIFNASGEGLTLCRLIRDSDGAAVDYQVLDVNPAHQRLTSATRAQMLATTVSNVAPPFDPRWISSAEQAVRTGTLQIFEVQSPATGCWLEIRVSPVSDDLFAQTFIDVSARREVEEQRARLVAEMHHRVKNNFQMVASVLQLQARRSPNAEVRDQLAAARQRIQVLAELHDSLAVAPEAGDIDFGGYLALLCEKLRGSIEDPERVRLTLRADAMTLEVDVAVPLGFVVNELVTNAIKYAYPAPAVGEIRVVFATEDGGFTLTVADDGPGLPKEAKGTGLGMRLVSAFAAQIGGQIHARNNPGVRYAISVRRG